MTPDRTLPGDWHPGKIPANVTVDDDAYVETTFSFLLHRSEQPVGGHIGRGASIYLGTMFDTGPRGRVHIGDYTLVNGARIICDEEVTIGDYVLISWNVVLMDTYRLPADAAERRRELEQAPRRQPRRLQAEVPARVGSDDRQPLHHGRRAFRRRAGWAHGDRRLLLLHQRGPLV